jgi:tetratricopeptide (TPR) repeat protein
MNDRKRNTQLINRYLDAKNKNYKPYFDVTELDELLLYFDSQGDFENYEEIIDLGVKLHPAEEGLKIQAFEHYMSKKQYLKALGFAELISSNGIEYGITRKFFLLEGYSSLKNFDKIDVLVDELIFKDREDIDEIYNCVSDLIISEEAYNESLSFIQKGLKRLPNSPALREVYCNYLDANERYDEAYILCDELIDSDPYLPEYWQLLSKINMHQLKFEEAVDACDFALISAGNDTEIILQKAFCCSMLGNYEEVLELYLQAYRLENQDKSLHPFIAECCIKLQKHDQAYTWLQDYIYDDSIQKEALAYLNYMECCAELGLKAEEQLIFDTLAKLYPDNIILLYLKALQSTQAGDDASSIIILEEVLLKFSGYDVKPEILMECYFKMGTLFFDVKNYQKAYEYFLKTVRIKKKYPEINLKLAECCLYLNLFKELTVYIKRLKVKEKKIFIKEYIVDSTFTAAENEELLNVLENKNKKKDD